MHQQLWGYNVEEKTSGGMRIRKAEYHWSKLFDPTQVSCQIIGIRFLTAVVMKSSTFSEQTQPFCQMLSHWPVWDRLCGLVVRVLGYRFGGLGFDSQALPDFPTKKKKENK
jgi:hypothetical protein